uniref:Uncharacterized protein n=1 Tax=Arundo donax TaxID=35708 RepID=A0A0A9F0E4_ARUDO
MSASRPRIFCVGGNIGGEGGSGGPHLRSAADDGRRGKGWVGGVAAEAE